MNRNNSKSLTSLFLAAVLIAFGGAMQSCINDSDSCPPDNRDDDMVISFRLMSGLTGHSRAADSGGHDEDASEWPAFEDIIQENDFAFFLFVEDKAGGWPLLMKMIDPYSSNEYMKMEEKGGEYSVTAVLPRSVFEAKIGRQVVWGQGQQIKFRVVAIANSGYPYGYRSLDGDSYDKVISQASDMMFRMESIHSTSIGDSDITGIYKGAIPMYGMNTFIVDDDILMNSSEIVHAWIGNIDMLRALVKIRVEDNIEKTPPVDGDGNPRKELPAITEVSVVSSTDRAYILPKNPFYYLDNPDDMNVAPSSKSGEFEYKLGFLPGEDKQVRIGYLPEQAIVTGGTPKVLVTVEFYEDNDAQTTAQQTYEVPLSGYDGVDFSDNLGDGLIRDHVYTLRIDGVRLGGKLDLEVEAAEWQTAEDYILDFTQTATIRDLMSWDGEVGPIDDDGNVVIAPWTVTPRPLKGDFFLQGPLGGTWTANLLTLEGTQDAFYFIDADGNDMGDSFSGDINGKDPQKFSIVSRDPAPASANRAKLQILVTVGTPPNATVTEVFLGPKNVTYTNFTIVQNPVQ